MNHQCLEKIEGPCANCAVSDMMCVSAGLFHLKTTPLSSSSYLVHKCDACGGVMISSANQYSLIQGRVYRDTDPPNIPYGRG